MFISVCELEIGMFVYENHKIYSILEKIQHAKYVRLYMEEFESKYKLSIKFINQRNIRVLEPKINKFMLITLLDTCTDGSLFVSLLNDNGIIKEDISIYDKYMIKYLKEYFNKSDEPLNINVTHICINPLHKNEKKIDIEKITHIEGFNM